MKIRILFLVCVISLGWGLSGATEPTDTFPPGAVRNGQVKWGNTHSGRPSGEPVRDIKQAVKESKKPQTEGDICLYGPRDIPSVMTQPARTAVARSWP
jgi:hypothetical protein